MNQAETEARALLALPEVEQLRVRVAALEHAARVVVASNARKGLAELASLVPEGGPCP